jgi:hypothetical protein
MRDRIVATIAHKPASTLGLVVIFFGFGLGLLLQPLRWTATPAYGNLLLVLSAASWGFCYLALGVVLCVTVFVHSQRWFYIGAHALAFMLLASWEAAFVVRWLTDPKTTIANVIAWAAYLALVARSATLFDTYVEAAAFDDEAHPA